MCHQLLQFLLAVAVEIVTECVIRCRVEQKVDGEIRVVKNLFFSMEKNVKMSIHFSIWLFLKQLEIFINQFYHRVLL